MKTGQVSKDMLKDPQTITAWADMPEFRPWFSEKARGLKGQRDFNESEYDTVNAIRYLRNQNRSIAEIAGELNNGFHTDEPPPGLATRSTTMPATVYANQIAAIRENEELRQQISRQSDEITRLSQLLQETTERLMNERMKSEQGIMSERMDREERLNRQIGKLEGQVEVLREQLDELKLPRKQTDDDSR